jgi:cytochrome bd-type quinol oxidase subunit 2
VNFGLWFLVGSLATIAIAATLCARRRAYRTYLACVAVLTVAGIVLVFASMPPHHSGLGAGVTSVVMYAPLGVMYGLVPGYLVRRAASRREVLFTTAVITIVGVPIWFGYALYVSCYVGHDCL